MKGYEGLPSCACKNSTTELYQQKTKETHSLSRKTVFNYVYNGIKFKSQINFLHWSVHVQTALSGPLIQNMQDMILQIFSNLLFLSIKHGIMFNNNFIFTEFIPWD